MRRSFSIALLAAALAGAGALSLWGASQGAGETATYRVEAIGPGGVVVLDESVEVPNATVLSTLEAAAARRGLALALEDYPGMGTYVRAIGTHEAKGATGWVYEVRRDDGWLKGDRSAEFYALQKGDSVRWTWTDA